MLRHPDEDGPSIAANCSDIPIINDGNEAKEHPTQAFLDLFTIQEEMGTVDGLTITFVGDLKYGRTIHPFCELLKFYHITINLCSPPGLNIPADLREELKKRGQLNTESTELTLEIVSSSNVLYCTRVQKERFEDLQVYEKGKDLLAVDTSVLKYAKSKMTLMHPLPRNKEIPRDVDFDSRAAYFRQVSCGI